MEQRVISSQRRAFDVGDPSQTAASEDGGGGEFQAAGWIDVACALAVGPAGADSTVTRPTGSLGPTGSDSVVTGPKPGSVGPIGVPTTGSLAVSTNI